MRGPDQASWGRELAGLRARAARLRSTRLRQEHDVLLDEALALIDVIGEQCVALQQRCSGLDQALRASEDGMARLLDVLPLAIVIADGIGMIRAANRAACLLLGRSQSKLVDDFLMHFFDNREGFSRIIRQLPSTTTPPPLQVRLLRTDRAAVRVELTARPDPRAESNQWVWVVQPIDA
jgi:PAS domain-containing protein